MKLYNRLTVRAPLFLSAVGVFSFVMATLAQSINITNPPALPNINTNNVINITNAPYYAVGNGVLTNTVAISNAIVAAAAGGTTNGLSGGTVLIPGPGTYLCGPLILKSKVNLQVDNGATLKMLPYAKWSGTTTFITGSSLQDVMISGLGTIDGQGWDWWVAFTNSSISRPYFINFTGSSRILIEGVTLTNPPTFHLMLKGSNKDITIQSIIINTPPSKNTDGMDLGSSNVLVQNCYISDGDDNIEIGGSSDLCANLVVTNCHFGIGHGVSIGGYTQGCISNVTVVDCTFTNTDYAIRMKSDYDRGGIIQNLSYCNITNHNIKYAPICIYSYYNQSGYGNPTTAGVTPLTAYQMAVQSTNTTPRYRNIIISNFVCDSAGQPGMIWARTEMPATNIVLSKLNITATGSYQNFEIYNAKQIQIIDSQFTLSASAYTNSWLFNADVTFSNTIASTTPISLFGITTNSYINKLAFYNCPATVSYTNTLGAGPLTLGDSTLTVSNNLTLFPATVLNYVLDPNTNQVAVVGNLAMGGTVNVTTNASGFTAGTNTLLTYTGTLSGALPTLGSTPGGPYAYSIITNTTSKQVSLVVTSTNSSTPTTTSVQSSANPSTYGNTVMFTAMVSPAPANGESVTFKDGSTTLGTGTLNGGQATYTTTATQLAAVSHSITAVYAGDSSFGGSTSSALTQTVNARSLTVSGLTVNSKTYDRTYGASLATNGYALNTVISGDVVTLLTNGSTVNFASSNVANGISVTVSGLSLSGAQAGNYSLTQPTGLTGNITALTLTISGLTVNSKVYDGTTGGSLNTNGYVLNTVVAGDTVTLVTNGSTVTFASPNVANGINVTVSGLSLGGAQAGNYSLTQPTGLTGNITPAGSSVALSASANPVAHLSSVAFTANMTPATLSGTVLFLTNGVAFDSQTLTGGTATSAATAVLPRGTNTITAQYSGNSNYSPSTNTLSEFVTNNPPTANPAVYYRLAGYPLTIVIADLATNWNDLDGDTMTLAGVSSPSTNGVVVAYDSADIYYTNANNVTDRFGYTISDGQGGTNNGTVTVLVAQQTVSSVAVNNGSVTLDFTGIPGSTYWVMAATNLVPPINWTPLSTNVVGTNGLWEFTDTQATNFIYRFYRTQSGH